MISSKNVIHRVHRTSDTLRFVSAGKGMAGERRYAPEPAEARTSRLVPAAFPFARVRRTSQAPLERASSSPAPDGERNCFSSVHQFEVDQIPAVVLGVSIPIPVATPTNVDAELVRDSHHVASEVAKPLSVRPVDGFLPVFHHYRSDVDSS